MLLHLPSPLLVRVIGFALLALFAVALVRLARLDLLSYCAVVLLLFLLLSKQVLEQYYLWPMPFLIFLGFTGDKARRRSSLGLLTLLSAAGLLANPFIHPFGPYPVAIDVAVALGILLYVTVWDRTRGDGPIIAHALEQDNGEAPL